MGSAHSCTGSYSHLHPPLYLCPDIAITYQSSSALSCALCTLNTIPSTIALKLCLSTPRVVKLVSWKSSCLEYAPQPQGRSVSLYWREQSCFAYKGAGRAARAQRVSLALVGKLRCYHSAGQWLRREYGWLPRWYWVSRRPRRHGNRYAVGDLCLFAWVPHIHHDNLNIRAMKLD